MASQEAIHVLAIMRAGKVTANEAMAFMGQALTIMEQEKAGAALDFVKELIALRGSRSFPDLSGVML